MISADLTVVLPELILSIFAMLALIVAVYTGKDKTAGLMVWVTAGVFVILSAMIGLGGEGTQTAFNGMFVDDAFARYAKVVILLSAAVILVLSLDYMAKRDILKFEYPLLVALSVVGMMVMVSSGDLIALYMGLELQSLALYVVASLHRDSLRSTEAGLKYFVLGALSSGLLLYGASLIYGFAGTTQFTGIITAASGEVSLGLLFGLVFLIAGLAFKVSAAPFHMWTPDVYEGSPTAVTAFFATAPKVAALGLFARVMHDAFGQAPHDWQQIVAFLSVISMFLGAIAAIGQRDIKRLMAYSSIAHMGFALMGLAAGTALGVQAMLTYATIYVLMNIGAFAVILSMEKDGKAVTDITALNMLSKREPLKAYSLLLIFFSLAGVPPLLGFVAKFRVLEAAVEGGLIWLAVAGVVASVIGAFYYLRIVYFMFFGEETDNLDSGMSPILKVAMGVSALILIVGLFNTFGVEQAAATAAASLVN